MAQAKPRTGRKRNASQSVIKRLRARLKKLSSKKSKTSMAFGRNRSRFSSPFRRRGTFRQRRSFRGGSSGFSRRAPLLGFKIPSILIWLAIIGGGIFMGKDYIKPLIDKLTKKT